MSTPLIKPRWIVAVVAVVTAVLGVVIVASTTTPDRGTPSYLVANPDRLACVVEIQGLSESGPKLIQLNTDTVAHGSAFRDTDRIGEPRDVEVVVSSNSGDELARSSATITPAFTCFMIVRVETDRVTLLPRPESGEWDPSGDGEWVAIP